MGSEVDGAHAASAQQSVKAVFVRDHPRAVARRDEGRLIVEAGCFIILVATQTGWAEFHLASVPVMKFGDSQTHTLGGAGAWVTIGPQEAPLFIRRRLRRPGRSLRQVV